MVAILVISYNICMYGTYFIVSEAHLYHEIINLYFKMFVHD